MGAILVPAHHTLRHALNDHEPFIEIETDDGRHAFLLKTEIARIDPHDRVEPADGNRANEWSRFDANDARVVLRVAADATEQEIQAAWRDLATAYHPDRLAAFGLPDEMLSHADRVLARITAFQRLKNDASAQSDRKDASEALEARRATLAGKPVTRPSWSIGRGFRRSGISASSGQRSPLKLLSSWLSLPSRPCFSGRTQPWRTGLR